MVMSHKLSTCVGSGSKSEISARTCKKIGMGASGALTEGFEGGERGGGTRESEDGVGTGYCDF